MTPASPNRFDLIRLVLAAVVFAYHGVVLSAVTPFAPLERVLAHGAELAIEGFFIVSGALVSSSLARSATLADYSGKRVRRLYPAYVVVVLVPALAAILLAAGSGARGIGVSGIFSSVLHYLGANLAFLNFLHPTLPGLFEENRFTEVNGALWTLKIEVLFYLVLPLIAFVLRKSGRAAWAILALLYAMGEIWARLVPGLVEGPTGLILARQLPGQMAYFASGIGLFHLWARAEAQPLRFGLLGLALFALSYAHEALSPLRAAGLAGLIAGVAFLPGPGLAVARFGDISYGLYIVHFPVLQAMAMAGVFTTLGRAPGLALSAILVFALSLLLWHSVEKPALRPASHYRRKSRP